MIKLTVGNSECQIIGLIQEQTKVLKELLSYSIDPQANYFSGGYKNPKRYLIDPKGRFATGLLQIVGGYLYNHDLKYELNDTRIMPKSTKDLFNLDLGYTPYPEQLEIASRAEKLHRGTISAVTGFGKSIAMALVVNQLQVKTLIIVPNLELKRQLTDSFLKYFGSMANITIENIDSASLIIHTDYDCLIIDEAHHVAAKTYRTLNKKAWKNIYYRFFFTATPFRSRDEEQLLFESIAGQIIYRVDYHTAVQKGYIVPMEAYYYELPKTETEANTWAGVYSALVVNNVLRNAVIARLLNSLSDSGISTLCLVKEIKHGETLKAATNGFFGNGQDEMTQWYIQLFNERKLKALIGTTGVLGEGVDTKPCEFVIIAGLGKSKNAFIQQVGRGFRKSPDKESCKVIIFLDKSHKWTLAHYKAQVKYLQEVYGITPIKLNID